MSLRDSDLSKLHEIANKELASIDFGENVYDVNFIRKANSPDLHDLIFDLCQYEQNYGQQNPEPVIAITNLHASRADCKVIGKNQDTVRIEFNGITYIKFHAKELIEELQKYDDMEITMIGRPNINNWRGMETPQLMIIDCEVEDSRFAF